MQCFLCGLVGLALGGLGLLVWWKRDDIKSFVERVTAAMKSSAASHLPPSKDQQQPEVPRTTSPVVSDDDMDATMVVNRGNLGSIVCCSGVLLGKQFDIPPQGLMIGRDPGSAVVVDDRRISGKHAYIRPKQGKVVVLDAQSQNGVYINDFQSRVLGETVLKPGDVIMLSPTDAAQFIYREKRADRKVNDP